LLVIGDSSSAVEPLGAQRSQRLGYLDERLKTTFDNSFKLFFESFFGAGQREALDNRFLDNLECEAHGAIDGQVNHRARAAASAEFLRIKRRKFEANLEGRGLLSIIRYLRLCAVIELKVRAVGGSLGVILPKEALSHLKLQEGDRLFLTEALGGGYQLTPYSPEFERQMAVVEEVARRRRNVLRELAK
jgi:putative addiction module antidote